MPVRPLPRLRRPPGRPGGAADRLPRLRRHRDPARRLQHRVHRRGAVEAPSRAQRRPPSGLRPRRHHGGIRRPHPLPPARGPHARPRPRRRPLRRAEGPRGRLHRGDGPVSAAAILGCAGPALSPAERAFFRDADPWGFILFARNVKDPAQLLALTSEFRETVGRDAPIFVDQEGGRVARLRAPALARVAPAPRRLRPPQGRGSPAPPLPPHRPRAPRGGDRRQLHAPRRRGLPRDRRGHLHPCARPRRRDRRPQRPRGGRRAAGGGRAAGPQAPPRPRPRHRRQPLRPAGGGDPAARPGRHGLRRLPPSRGPAARHDRARGLRPRSMRTPRPPRPPPASPRSASASASTAC